MKSAFTIALLTVAMLVSSRPAHASVIGTTLFDGDLYTLEQLTGTTFKLTVDTDGSNAQNYIKAVAINLGGPSSGGSLLSTTAPGTWAYVDGGTNSGGCNGAGAPFDCAGWVSGAMAFDNGSVYSWTWQILNTKIDASSDHLKSVYYNSNGTSTLSDDRFAGLQLSQDLDPSAPIPEPASLLLLGTGITAMAAKVRNRRQKS